jgi:hypothetical protein
MHKYLEKKNEVNFDKIFNQMLGEYLHNMASLQNSKMAIGTPVESVCNLVGTWRMAKQRKCTVRKSHLSCCCTIMAKINNK